MTEFLNDDHHALAQVMSGIFKNPEVLLIKHIEALKKSDKISKGLMNIVDTVESGCEENVRKQLKNTIISCKKLSDCVYFIAVCNLIYILGETREKDIVTALQKLGANPDVLLQYMFNKKFKQ